jgi:TonB family protein
LRFLAIVLLSVLLQVAAQAVDINQNRKSAVDHMAQDFSRLGFHKLYVPDSCDSSFHANDISSFFAYIFSRLLETNHKDFTVLNRAEAHRFLLKNQWTDCDLMKADVLTKFVAALGVDSILSVAVSSDNNSFSVDFSFRDLTGKELLRSSYKEPFEAFTLGCLPPVAAPSGWPFYFVGEGIKMPKAIKMQNPPYPEKLRAKHVSGTVVISALVNPDGKIYDARLVQKVDPDLDKASLEVTKAWRFKPAEMPDGTLVPVRVPFEITFRTY